MLAEVAIAKANVVMTEGASDLDKGNRYAGSDENAAQKGEKRLAETEGECACQEYQIGAQGPEADCFHK